MRLLERGIDLPMTLGHEPAGIVEKLGDEAKKDQKQIREGDPVVVYPWLGCGSCRKCRAGFENLCETRARTLGIFQDGGYAENLLVPDVRYLVPLQKTDTVRAAPLGC